MSTKLPTVVVESWKGGSNGRIELATNDPQSHLNLYVYENSSYHPGEKMIYLSLSPAKGAELRDELLKLYPLPVEQTKPPKAHFSVGRAITPYEYPLRKTYLKEVTEKIGTFESAVDAEVAAAAFNREQQERAQ
jgi:hypothetical protein